MTISSSRQRIFRLITEQQRAEAIENLEKIDTKIADLEGAFAREEIASEALANKLSVSKGKGIISAGRLSMEAHHLDTVKAALKGHEERIDTLSEAISFQKKRRDHTMEILLKTHRALQIVKTPPKK